MFLLVLFCQAHHVMIMCQLTKYNVYMGWCFENNEGNKEETGRV